MRLLIFAALLGLVAKLIAKAKRSAEPTASPDWPTWSERQGADRSTDAKPENATPGTTNDRTHQAVGQDGATWVEPVNDSCPAGYEVKVKESSGIYHVAGMRNYERTNPDRCYPSTEAAETDGFRASKV